LKNIGACSRAAGRMKGCAPPLKRVPNSTYGLYSAPAVIYPANPVTSIRIVIERFMKPVSTAANRIALACASDVFLRITGTTLSALNRYLIERTNSSAPSISILITLHSLQEQSSVCISYDGLIYTSCRQSVYGQMHRLLHLLL